MTLRRRTLVGATALILLPLSLLGWWIHTQVENRILEGEARVEAARLLHSSSALRSLNTRLETRLAAIANTISSDNRVRLSVATDREDLQSARLDFAESAMSMTGLDFLRIQTADGRILCSGHFRNEYDTLDEATLNELRGQSQGSLVTARRPEGELLVFARAHSLDLGTRRVFLLGGSRMDANGLQELVPEGGVAVTLDYPGGKVEVPCAAGSATLDITALDDPARDTLRDLDAALLLAWLVAAAGTLLLAGRLAAKVASPVEELASRAARLDWEDLRTDFPEDTRDEVGTLSRVLNELAARLRAGAVGLREAERRATLGDLARQVNHDLRNGLTPIRNVVRHLSETAADSPAELARIFEEREATLAAGLDYLDELAGNYARLSTQAERRACDVERVLREATAGLLAEEGGEVRLAIPADLPPVMAERLGLRRVVENLIANARDAVKEGGSSVVVAAGECALANGAPGVRVTVTDDGPGISAEDRSRIFEAFYTTRGGGSGLGLAIVRRIVSDLEGVVSVESAPASGTTVAVTLPAAPVAGQEEDS
ncbi:MAG: HAMP domain-containing sensor histidine kinase [Gemmatimonadota bacterium]|jgi:signal transduction histidine kinase|nr:HAMP domain-containing sensor histidine kinase [Gemmatimonadota bacterium]MDP6802926.1 HAMP domain-containing sensor histidine kinase [Gemmatimonadota bacterium]MDP7030662.1 HAMP domain-containing sensor histidine kinase [Gemmatimonadota bacterium]